MRSNGRSPILRSVARTPEQREKLTQWLPEGMAFDATGTARQRPEPDIVMQRNHQPGQAPACPLQLKGIRV